MHVISRSLKSSYHDREILIGSCMDLETNEMQNKNRPNIRSRRRIDVANEEHPELFGNSEFLSVLDTGADTCALSSQVLILGRSVSVFHGSRSCSDVSFRRIVSSVRREISHGSDSLEFRTAKWNSESAPDLRTPSVRMRADGRGVMSGSINTSVLVLSTRQARCRRKRRFEIHKSM